MNLVMHHLTLPQLSKRQGARISVRTRLWASGVGAFGMLMFLGLFLDPTPYETELYRIHRQVLPIQAWAWAWFITSLGWLACVLTRSIRLWMLVSVLTFMFTTCWAACLLIGKWLGEPIPPSLVGLWGFVLFTYILEMIAPIQLEQEANDRDLSNS